MGFSQEDRGLGWAREHLSIPLMGFLAFLSDYEETLAKTFNSPDGIHIFPGSPNWICIGPFNSPDGILAPSRRVVRDQQVFQFP